MAFQEWSIPQVGRRGQKMSNNEVSLFINTKKGNYKTLTFSQDLSNDLRKNGFTYLVIRQDDLTMEIGLEFNKTHGVSLMKTGKEKINMRIGSPEWIEKLHQELKLTRGERHIIVLSDNLSKIESVRFYRIINVKN